jgi:hypothetical protein
MTIKIGLWIIPAMLTAICLGMMLRPYQRSGDYDFGSIFRLLWVLPISIIWAAYFGVLLLFRN